MTKDTKNNNSETGQSFSLDSLNLKRSFADFAAGAKSWAER